MSLLVQHLVPTSSIRLFLFNILLFLGTLINLNFRLRKLIHVHYCCLGDGKFFIFKNLFYQPFSWDYFFWILRLRANSSVWTLYDRADLRIRIGFVIENINLRALWIRRADVWKQSRPIQLTIFTLIWLKWAHKLADYLAILGSRCKDSSFILLSPLSLRWIIIRSSNDT